MSSALRAPWRSLSICWAVLASAASPASGLPRAAPAARGASGSPRAAPATRGALHALARSSSAELAAMLPPRPPGSVITYSRKVFIPLTRLCRDRCSYCTFAEHGGLPAGAPAFLTIDEVLAIASAGKAAGCTEALFTLGDRPEARWPAARAELRSLGFGSTVEYLRACCAAVLERTSLLPHANCGVLSEAELGCLREVTASQGLMLESTSERLLAPGGPHHRSVDKVPARRLATLEAAGRLRIPFTTGILVGIGESREERLDALAAIAACARTHGHIQEVIVQPFRAKEATPMAAAAEAGREELLWSVSAAKLLLGPLGVAVQCPPNLLLAQAGAPDDAFGAEVAALLAAGVDDWGGVSPGVTPDHVNPERNWPTIDALRAATEAAGHRLCARLPSHPRYAADPLVSGPGRAPFAWHSPAVAGALLREGDADGLARAERGGRWYAGDSASDAPRLVDGSEWLPGGARFSEAARWRMAPAVSPAVRAALAAALDKRRELSAAEIVALLRARGPDVAAVCAAADELRRALCGGAVSYVVCRNINYTNRCAFACAFCAFSKAPLAGAGAGGAEAGASQAGREPAYEWSERDVSEAAADAWARGATEVCMQGGIHPTYLADGGVYARFAAAAKAGAPGVHVHAFSPLEVVSGAAAEGVGVRAHLAALRASGLGSLPGTAAEVLVDEVRAVLCPDKLTADEWVRVVEAAHAEGLRTTSTIMFGSVEGPEAVAQHLRRLSALQARSGGLTEFVPLPFVHAAAPIYARAAARRGPTLREAVLMHAVARLALSPSVVNIQVSWCKLGPAAAELALRAGANDLGGTLMSESISRAAGASYGQELPPSEMVRLVARLDVAQGPDPADRRVAWQRTTLYERAPDERVAAAARAGRPVGDEAASAQ